MKECDWTTSHLKNTWIHEESSKYLPISVLVLLARVVHSSIKPTNILLANPFETPICTKFGWNLVIYVQFEVSVSMSTCVYTNNNTIYKSGSGITQELFGPSKKP